MKSKNLPVDCHAECETVLTLMDNDDAELGQFKRLLDELGTLSAEAGSLLLFKAVEKSQAPFVDELLIRRVLDKLDKKTKRKILKSAQKVGNAAILRSIFTLLRRKGP